MAPIRNLGVHSGPICRLQIERPQLASRQATETAVRAQVGAPSRCAAGIQVVDSALAVHSSQQAAGQVLNSATHSAAYSSRTAGRQQALLGIAPKRQTSGAHNPTNDRGREWPLRRDGTERSPSRTPDLQNARLRSRPASTHPGCTKMFFGLKSPWTRQRGCSDKDSTRRCSSVATSACDRATWR